MNDDDEIERIRARKLAELMAQVQKKESPQAPSGEPVILNDQNFADFVTRTKLVLVDFWATWCAPCKVVAPHVEDIGRRYAGKVAVAKMDIDKNPMTPAQFGVQSIPTLLLFKDGMLVDGVIGAVPKAQLESMVRKWM